MLEESIHHFIISICRVSFVPFFLFLMENLLAYNEDPNQVPHYVVSDLGLHCLPMTILGVSR